MECTRCRYKVDDSALACPRCGASIYREPAFAAPAPGDPLPVGAPVPAPPASRATGVPTAPYYANGTWWFDTGGETLMWNPSASQWVNPYAGTVYPYQRIDPMAQARALYLPLRAPMICVWIGLALFAVSVVPAILAEFAYYDRLDSFLNGSGTERRAQQGFDFLMGVKTFQMLAILGAVASFIWLWWRAAGNALAFGAGPSPRPRHWAIWTWFVPFANLVMPYLVFLKFWRAADPALGTRPGAIDWLKGSTSRFGLAWWLGGILCFNVLWSGTTQLFLNEKELSAEQLDTTLPMVLGELGALAGAVLSALVVFRLERYHRAAAARILGIGPKPPA